VFIVNTNSVFSFIWGLVKIFLPDRTLSKASEVHSTLCLANSCGKSELIVFIITHYYLYIKIVPNNWKIEIRRAILFICMAFSIVDTDGFYCVAQIAISREAMKLLSNEIDITAIPSFLGGEGPDKCFEETRKSALKAHARSVTLVQSQTRPTQVPEPAPSVSSNSTPSSDGEVSDLLLQLSNSISFSLSLFHFLFFPM
jgi:hypothetical protein